MRTGIILALAIGSGAFMLSQAQVFTWLRLLLLARAKKEGVLVIKKALGKT